MKYNINNIDGLHFKVGSNESGWNFYCMKNNGDYMDLFYTKDGFTVEKHYPNHVTREAAVEYLNRGVWIERTSITPN